MMELIHMTATYSNALLVAILPHVSDFAKKLNLPVQQPITSEQVARFNPSPYKDRIEGAVWLTNGMWFLFDHDGYVQGFRSPQNAFTAQEDLLEHLTNYLGHTRMATNEIVTFARETLLKLGYPPQITRADAAPEIHGPFDLKRGGHIPCCRVEWRSDDEDSDGYSNVYVDINTQEKSVVGLYLGFARTNKIGSPIKIHVQPELESEFRERTKAKMFFRSNAPPRVPSAK